MTGLRKAFSLYNALSNIRVLRYHRWHGYGTGRGLRRAQFACSSMKVPANRSRISSLNHISKHSRFCSLSFTPNRRKCTELARIVPEQSQGARGQWCAQTGCSHKKRTVLVLFCPTSCVLGLCQDPAPRPKMVERRVAENRVKTVGQ